MCFSCFQAYCIYYQNYQNIQGRTRLSSKKRSKSKKLCGLYTIYGNVRYDNQYQIRMIESRKNKIRCYDDLLAYFNTQSNKTVTKYMQIMNDHGTTSLSILNDQFTSYSNTHQLKQKIIPSQKHCQQDDSTIKFKNKHSQVPPSAKKFYASEEYAKDDDIQKQSKGVDYSLLKTSKKFKKNSSVKGLQKKMKRMDLGGQLDVEMGYDGDGEREQDDWSKEEQEKEELLKSSLKQMILQTSKKDQSEAISKNQHLYHQQIQNQLDECFQTPQIFSEYQMTDYSSNQSSNEGQYSPRYSYELQQKPLFPPGMFSIHHINKTKPATNMLKFNLKPKQLLQSPKKTHKKRLFIGKKKIPRWAQDMQKIREQAKLTKRQDSRAIFGTCQVQHLNTNLIFGIDGMAERTSSAKWVKSQF